MATSAAATSAVSRVSSASEESNKAAACSARSTTSGAGAPGVAGDGTLGAERAEGTSAARKVSATARATPCVRDAGLGLPVTTAIRISVASIASSLYLIIPIDLIYKNEVRARCEAGAGGMRERSAVDSERGVAGCGGGAAGCGGGAGGEG